MMVSHTPGSNVPSHLQPGTGLRHYKDGLYWVDGACLIEGTMQTGILYSPEQGSGTGVLWMRKALAFDETVSTEAGPVTRFTVL